MSKGRTFIITEDFGFKPDSFVLSLKLTDICNKGEFETNKERLKKVFGPQNEGKWLSINTLKMHIKTLLTNPSKFPSLPLQEIPKEGFFFEELSDLFYVSKKGGKNLVPRIQNSRFLLTSDHTRFAFSWVTARLTFAWV